MSKKGQVSLMILVGLLILVLAGIFFYVSVESESSFQDPLTPVERYITTCLEDAARQAFVRIGMQGGYVDLPFPAYQHHASHFSELQGGAKVPLWIFRGNVLIPQQATIEREVATYIEQIVGRCIATIEQLESIEVMSLDDSPNATVFISEEDVFVQLSYSVQLRDGERDIMYNRFATRLDLRFRTLLENAIQVVRHHQEDMFFEQATVNLIAMDESMPMGGVDFSCQRLRWSKREIQHTFQETLQAMVPRFRVQNAHTLPFSSPMQTYLHIERNWDLSRVEREGLPENLPPDSYEYFQQMWNIDHDFRGMSVGFSYFPQYGMRMEINPSSGDRLIANPGRSGYLRFICLNIYHFTYSLEYPLKVTLYDESAFNGQGYAFSFGLPVTISRNLPTRDPVHFYQMQAIETDETFCEETGDDIYILAQDIFTADYITGVNITYDCIRYYCELGETDFFGGFNVPQIRTGLPVGCYNGFFIAEKEGYVPFRRQMIPTGSVILGMVPLKEFFFEVTLLGGEVTSDYDISIFLDAKEYDYEVFTTYPFLEGSPIIELIAGPAEYSVEIFATSRNKIVGGWIGNLTVDSVDLMANTIIFNLYEQVPHPQTPEQEVNLYMYLDEDLPETDVWFPYRERLPIEFRYS